MKRALLSIAALILLVSCQKQLPTEKEEVLPTTSSNTMDYSSALDTTRIRLAQGIANCIQSQTFRQGLSEGLSLMRDGDNEVLIVEGIGRGKNTGNKKQPDEKFSSHLRIGKLITL